MAARRDSAASNDASESEASETESDESDSATGTSRLAEENDISDGDGEADEDFEPSDDSDSEETKLVKAVGAMTVGGLSKERTLANIMIRSWATSSNFTILKPPATPPIENDHFFEVQHVVDFLFSQKGPLNAHNFYSVPTGYWVDLSSRISGHNNIFAISEKKNQAKKKIDFASYASTRPNATIKSYLKLETREGKTVEAMLRVLVEDMVKFRVPFSYLTQIAGVYLGVHMGWMEASAAPKIEEPAWVKDTANERKITDWAKTRFGGA